MNIASLWFENGELVIRNYRAKKRRIGKMSTARATGMNLDKLVKVVVQLRRTHAGADAILRCQGRSLIYCLGEQQAGVSRSQFLLSYEERADVTVKLIFKRVLQYQQLGKGIDAASDQRL